MEQVLRNEPREAQRQLLVVEDGGALVGVIRRGELHQIRESKHGLPRQSLREIALQTVSAAFPDEPLRAVVYRMAEMGVTRMPGLSELCAGSWEFFRLKIAESAYAPS